MIKGRQAHSIRNINIGLAGQFVSLFLNFLCRTVFIMVLGIEYLSLNALLTSIVTMLSLAELGVGSAITYSLYKPLATGDEKKIAALMNLYARAYKLIGVSVAVVGFLLIPILSNVTDGDYSFSNIIFIYLLYLTNAVISYFFSYKGALISADQKLYINNIYSYGIRSIQYIVCIIVLLSTESFILYLIIQIISSLVTNLLIYRRANSMYPFLKKYKDESLSKEEKNEIYMNIKAMFFHKIGGVVLVGTDNIVISKFVGFVYVGIYSNYMMVINSVTTIINTLFASITASIGNLNTEDSIEKSYEIFNRVFFVNFLIYSFCSTCLYVLLNPFIQLWLGEEFLLTQSTVMLIVLNFYLIGMRQTVMAYKNTTGLFYNDRFKPIVECFLNLFLSILLATKIGLPGVLLGTSISFLLTSFWVDPYFLFKIKFRKNPMIYLGKYFFLTIVGVINLCISYTIASLVVDDTFLSIFIKMMICVSVTIVFYSIIFVKNKEFSFFINYIIGFAKKKISSR